MTCLRFSSSFLHASKWQLMAVGLLLCVANTGVVADDGLGDHVATPEYKLKAALLFKLTRFVSWPDLSSDDGEFNICVLGENVFGNTLQPLEARKVKTENIDIEYYSQSDDIESYCKLLFIEKSKQPFLKSILENVRGSGVLTISDIDGFAEQGGVVGLTLDANKIGLKINLSSARGAGLSIAAPLLQLATIVESGAAGDSHD